jgi:choice-of-anchor B domain-containing protein
MATMRILSFFLLLLTFNAKAQTNVTLRSTMTFSNQHLANIWGYAAGGYEYALVGGANGMIVVDVTNPDAPSQVVQITGPSSTWREIETYSHYAYIVSEAGAGVQIVDLNNLPGTNLPSHSYYGDGAINNQLSTAHALHVDLTKGYLYVYGSNLFGGKTIVLNLNSDPYNPTYVNYVSYVGYAHDGYVDNDMLYSAHIYAGQFAIVNMANKSNPVLVATQPTPNAVTHNTWLNGTTLFTTDEVTGSYLSAYDISNPGNITLLAKIQSNPGTGSIAHNTHILNDFAITSWYKDGFTIVDVARPANLVQTGNYDTYSTGGNGYEGCWGVYPFLPSGTIVASNIHGYGNDNGELYVCTPTYTHACYLEGTVTNASNGNPLVNAQVVIPSTGTATISGGNGQYKMGQLQNGTFTVQVNKLGYQPYSTTVTLTNGVLTTLNVQLTPAPTPIELISFSARADQTDAVLVWETASEVNNSGFEIQQSRDGRTWQVAGWVDAKGPSTYTHRIPGLSPGTYFFRLRQVDFDGTSTLCPVQSLEIANPALRMALWPNRVIDQCRIRLNTLAAATARIDIYDASQVATGLGWTVEVDKEMEMQLPVESLPAGTYVVVVQTETGRISQLFVKIH